jgi:hypothetical protein
MPKRMIDEVEMSAHRPTPTQEDFGDLFAPLGPSEPPTRPVVTRAEQRALPLAGGTLEGDYQAWRQTAMGQFVYDALRTKAIGDARTGARRLSAKGLVEWVRAMHKVDVNNSYTALLARELTDREPELRGLFELRERTAA